MIEIRIRLDSQARPVHLCEWDAGNLDALLPTVECWGIEHDGNDYGITGSFVLGDGEAYFELVVHETDDG